jgi:uncharacterized protein (TIGR02594 family)
VRELPGKRHNPTILEYLKTALNIGHWGRSRDETPWCAAFVNWCLEEAGYEGTGHGLARKFIQWGVESEPRLGAIIVVRYKGHKDLHTGSRNGFHVGFLVHDFTHSFRILGGNQRNRVSFRNFPKRFYECRAIRWPS